jgi:hypothetical protein
MNRDKRNLRRPSRIAEDMALIYSLQMAIVECRIVIDQSRSTIESTLDAIRFLDQLQERRQSAEPDVYVTTSVSMIARKAASVMARRTIRPT